MWRMIAMAAIGGLISCTPQTALAQCPEVGAPIIVKNNGQVIAKFVGSTASYHNDLYLDSPAGAFPGIIFNNKTSPIGGTVNLGTFAAGTELIFRIHVNNTGEDFYSGAASRNHDGLPHARIKEDYSPTETLVEFEDLQGLPECSLGVNESGLTLTPGGFNDLSFTFTNVRVLRLDSFLNYRVRPARGSAKFNPRSVTLVDQLENGPFTALKPLGLGNPASKSGEIASDPDTHLEAYQIVASSRHVRRDIKVNNQFGELLVTTTRTDRLLMPTAISPSSSVDPLDPSSHDVDAFKCYSVRRTRGAAPFKRIRTTVGDQFTSSPKTFDLLRPSRLCLPVEVEGAEIKNPETPLMCYAAKASRGQPRYQPIKGAFVNNDFGPGQVDAIREEELCLPSAMTVR